MSSELFDAIRVAVDKAQRDTTTAERERIAELERDLAHARAQHRSLDIAFTEDTLMKGKVIGALQEENAKLRALIAGKGEKLVDDAPVVEEQGPWVVMVSRGYGLPMARCLAEGMLGTVRSSEIDKAMVFKKKADAERQCVDKDERVITLAEARALVAAKMVAP